MNLNEYGCFEAMKKTVDKAKAKACFEKQERKKLPQIKTNIKTDEVLRKFIP